jgi:hypothetical protein
MVLPPPHPPCPNWLASPPRGTHARINYYLGRLRRNHLLPLSEALKPTTLHPSATGVLRTSSLVLCTVLYSHRSEWRAVLQPVTSRPLAARRAIMEFFVIRFGHHSGLKVSEFAGGHPRHGGQPAPSCRASEHTLRDSCQPGHLTAASAEARPFPTPARRAQRPAQRTPRRRLSFLPGSPDRC